VTYPRKLIGDFCRESLIELQTGPFGSQLHSYDYVEEGVAIVPTEAIRDRRISRSALPRVSDKTAARLARHRLELHDILFARRGAQATGQTAIVRDEDVGALCGTGAIRLRVTKDRGVVLPSFLSHFLSSPEAIKWIRAQAIGATMPNLNEGIVKRIAVPVPTFTTQTQIAALLDDFDDKIELNRRMNETLEAMAQAIFRDWFVSFGPTRRKIEGVTDPVAIMGEVVSDFDRAQQLADRFPTMLVHDGFPAGWRVRKIETVASRIAMGPFGSRITKDNFVDFGVPVIRGKNLGNGFVDSDFVYLTQEKAKQLSSSIARPEDIVFTHRGTLGQVGRIYPGANYSAYIVSQSQIVVTVDRSQIAPLFLYYFFISEVGQQGWLSNAGGAGVPAIASPTRSLRGIDFLDPGLHLAQEFDAVVGVLEQRIIAAKRETEVLQSTRDLLLPKLMSGEIRLRDVETKAEAGQ
jgi:type I restriction enzyme S subunit